MGMTAAHILSALGKMSKVPLSARVEAFVRTCTAGYGKVKLVLRRGRYFVESEVRDLVRLLVSRAAAAAACVRGVLSPPHRHRLNPPLRRPSATLLCGGRACTCCQSPTPSPWGPASWAL